MAKALPIRRSNAAMTQIVRFAVEDGWSVRRTRGGYLRFDKPGCSPVFTGYTPSDKRSERNALAMLRRVSRQVDFRGGRGMKSNREDSLDALSPRARGLLADLMRPMNTSSRPVYDLPSCTRHWYRAHQAFPGMRGQCELTVDQMIVLNGDVRNVLEYLGITPEWIRQRLAGRSPSDVADPRVDQE